MDGSQVRLSIPALPAFVSVARLTISGLAVRLGFDVDATEDIKLAVAEAVTLMLAGAGESTKSVELVASWDAAALTVALDGPALEGAEDDAAIAVMVMEEFMDAAQVERVDGRLSVSLTKQRPSAAAAPGSA